MGVIENQLNWRRVWPGPGVDVSGRSTADRMRLPDSCFGQRELIISSAGRGGADNRGWGISTIALPDPAVIWDMVILVNVSDYVFNTLRIGLADVVPTSEAEMNATQNIFPDFGDPAAEPPQISLGTTEGTFYSMPLRTAIVTSGRKLVVEVHVHASGTIVIASLHLNVSPLPDAVPLFLDPDFVS